MEKKYELVDLGVHSYYRIRALRDFSDVKKGDIGGFVEGEHNLSHEGDCWIYGNAMAFGNAKVCGNAKVYGNAEVFGDAKVCGDAIVCSSAEVFGDAKVCGNAKLQGSQRISNRAYITNTKQALSITGLGSVGRTTTFFLNEDSTIMVNCGCFNGTIDEFRKKVCESYEAHFGFGKDYLLLADFIEKVIRMENLD